MQNNSITSDSDTFCSNRDFKLHSNLLSSIIKRQAGSIEKALMEAVMNSADAGASSCIISIDEHGFSVEDNGVGFKTLEFIEKNFETFGRPHESNVAFGQFRMGRGQLFSFGKNIWKSNEFMMVVDIENNPSGYSLQKMPIHQPGCIVSGTWYNTLSKKELFSISTGLKGLVRYMPIKVIFNNEEISTNPADVSWDIETDLFYFKKNTSAQKLSVFNKGSHVTDYPGSKYGLTGHIVTKEKLELNLARNDILTAKCNIWKTIEAELSKITCTELKLNKSISLSADQRAFVLKKLINKELLAYEVLPIGLFKDISGKWLSLKDLLNISSISLSEEHSDKRILQRINNSGTCTILDHKYLAECDLFDINTLIFELKTAVCYGNQISLLENATLTGNTDQIRMSENWNPAIVLSELVEGFKAMEPSLKPRSDYTAKQVDLLKVLGQLNTKLSCLVFNNLVGTDALPPNIAKAKNFKRVVMLGHDNCAKAWTDATTYICINETLLDNPIASEIVTVLLHEYCHVSATKGDHDHTMEFYKRFHDIWLAESTTISALIKWLSTKIKVICK